MKKQLNLSAAGRKLSLNKKTISNLNEMEMNRKVGGSDSYFHQCGHCGYSKKNTCELHKTYPGYYTC